MYSTRQLRHLFFYSFLFFFFVISLNFDRSFSQETIIITADRLNTPNSQAVSSVRIISQDEIQRSNSNSVIEILKKHADFHLVSSGGIGQQTSIFMRGSTPGQTLVLLDGVEINDPSNPNRSFDFSNLSLNSIERIEVLKGPQSILYGSNAMSGVINIISKKGDKKKKQTDLKLSYGSFKTSLFSLGTGGNINNLLYRFGGNILQSEGISAAKVSENPNADKDGIKKLTFSSSLEKKIANKYILNFNGRFFKSKKEIDSGGGANNDDPDFYIKNREYNLKMQIKGPLFNWPIESILIIARNRHKRYSLNPPALFTNLGELNKLSLQNNYYINPFNTSSIGIEYTEEKDKSSSVNLTKNRAHILGVYLLHKYSGKTLSTSFGGRACKHQIFGTLNSYKFSLGYKILATNSNVKLNYSTGYKSPSLNQLYLPDFGNSDLKPEKSNNYEIGIEQKINNKSMLELIYFVNRFKNYLTYDKVTYINMNAGKISNKGIELFVHYIGHKIFDINFSYSRLWSKNHDTGKHLERVPSYKYGLEVFVKPWDKFTFNLSLMFTGPRDDVDPVNRQTTHLPSFFLANFHAKYFLRKNLKLQLNIKNILDRDYEEIDGYQTAGRSADIALAATF